MRVNNVTIPVPEDPGSNNTYIGVGRGGIYNNNPNASVVKNYYTPTIKPMFITKVIKRLSDPEYLQVTPDDIDFKRYKIHEKEDYNHLRRWKDDIKLYVPYRKYVEEIYQTFGDMGRFQRERVYRLLHHEYARLHDHLEADELFDALRDYVVDKVNQDVTLFDAITYEEMVDNVCIVLVEAFIECRIFEKPE